MDRKTAYRRRWQILAVLSLCLIVIGLDNLIITMALPKVQSGLNASIGDLQWTVDAYSVAFGGFLLFSGGLGDRFGRKLLLTLGLLGFAGFSLGAAFSNSPGMLIGFRAMMGLSAALIMPSTLSIIKDVFPREEQTRAIGIWGAAAGLGVPLGPLVGGVLLDHFWWGSIFLINAPVVGVTSIAGLALIPESRDPEHKGLDLGGAALSVAGLLALVFGLVVGPQYGWADARTLGPLIGGVALLVVFGFYEARISAPMLDVRLFRNPQFGGSALAIVCVGFCLFGSLFIMTQFFQFVRAYVPLSAGLRLLVVCVLVVTAALSHRLVHSVGLKVMITIGLAIIAGAAWVLTTAEASSDAGVLLSLGFLGLGLGIVMTLASDAILAATPAERSGAGSAVIDTSMQVGGSLGIAVLGSVLTTEYRNSLPSLNVLPPTIRETFRNSIGDASAVAAHMGASGKALAASANNAFLSGASSAAIISTVIAGLGALAVAVILPRWASVPGGQHDSVLESAASPAEASGAVLGDSSS
jgi:EmrB/QacA subfamily drug resistance transporter